MALSLFAAFFASCLVLVLIPGPVVTLVIANSLTHGTRAGLINVAGVQLGLAIIAGVVAAGLASLVAGAGEWFQYVRLIGAAYLLWLGWKLLRASGDLRAQRAAAPPRGGFFWQGFVVSISNPKTLFFFGAFFPQFMDPGRPALQQYVIMGATAMAIAAVCDSTYALLSGRAGAWLSQRRVRFLSRAGGLCLIGGGAWLALSRSR